MTCWRTSTRNCSALKEGLPFAEFRKRLEPKLKAKGWWGRREVIDPASGEVVEAQLGSRRRLKVIYEANMRTARAAGQWERAQRTKRMLPYFEYRLGPSKKHRAHHAAWAAKPTILPVDDPWWNVHYPPNGWGCKCWLRQISRREAERKGGPIESPPIEYRNWINRRTGEMEKIPVGIDPGWHTNPGKARARLRAVRQRMSAKLGSLPNYLVRGALQHILQSDGFRLVARGLAPSRMALPAGLLPQLMQKEIGSPGNVVLLSNETARKQISHHPESFSARPEDVYRLVPFILENARVFLEEHKPGHYSVHAMINDEGWRVIFKLTKNGELFLVSMHRLNRRTWRKAVRHAKRIIFDRQEK